MNCSIFKGSDVDVMVNPVLAFVSVMVSCRTASVLLYDKGKVCLLFQVPYGGGRRQQCQPR